MFKSKAETLLFLQKKLKLSKIPKTFYFSVLEWKKKKREILKKIKNKFNGKIIIRSSASGEDGFLGSNAGKYKSFLMTNKLNISLKFNISIKSLFDWLFRYFEQLS